MRVIVLIPLFVFALFLAGCGGCSPPPAENLPEGSACETSSQCADDLTCTRDGEVCGVAGCESHDDCGRGAICGDDGTCASNVAGGPCSDDDNCVGAETCQSGRCSDIVEEGGACTGAAMCAGELVCAPTTETCETSVGCSTHTDCGREAFCDDGTCRNSRTESPCDVNDRCAPDDRCFAGVCIPNQCEAENFVAEAVPPNLMIVLDRSGSMDDRVGGWGTPPKWDVALEAIDNLMTTYSGQIRFGLQVFPGTDVPCQQGGHCNAGTIAVDIGENTQGAINQYLESADTCLLGTPIAGALSMVADYAPLEDNARSNYVLLVTDGEDNCANYGTPPAGNPANQVRRLREKEPSVRTFVVGFGGGVSPQQLNALADEGGTALQGNRRYYQADDAASLEAAFQEIGGAVLGCEYTIPSEVPNPDDLFVFFDGIRVPRDPSHTTGWNYNDNNGLLTFAGNACTALRTGNVESLILVYGCPGELEPDPVDAGPEPGDDAGPGGGECSDRCDPTCGTQACLLDGNEGQCGPCESSADCCPGSICIAQSGECIIIGG